MRDPLIGTRINRYEIRESVHKSDVLGIYKAYDTKLERFVLVKTIVHSSDYSKEAVDFFLAESKTLAKLAHPNIAKVLDFGYENGTLYLISEFVPGNSLSDLMNRPMLWQNAVNILVPLTNALVYAHSRGVIHRDLKPDNIIINTDGQPILSDFSLMRIIEDEETRDMTGTKVGLGSPDYISPEQGQGLTVDFRSDIYSLGVIFFEMVTGKKLFYATSSMEIVIQHIMAAPPKPRTIIPTLPKMVETVILNALSKDRENRYQTMEAFSNALKELIDANNQEKKSQRRLSRPLAFSAAGIITLLVLGLIFRNQIIPTSTATGTPTNQGPETRETSSAPTATPRVTAEPTEPIETIAVSSNDAFDDYQFPELPVLPGAKLPAANQALDVNNVDNIVELAHWGTPDISQLAWIHNDEIVLAATSAGIYLLDPSDLSLRLFFDTGGAVIALDISDDGQLLATADTNDVVTVWRLQNGQKLHQTKGKAHEIKSVDFSPDNSKLAISDSTKNIFIWNLDRDQTFAFDNRLSGNANKVLFTDNGETVISGSGNFQIMLWDAISGDVKGQYAAAQGINDMSLSPDGHYLALALDDARIQIWDVRTWQPINQIKDPTVLYPFTDVTFLPNNSDVLMIGSADGFIRIFNVNGSVPLWENTSADQSDNPVDVNPVRTMAVSSTGASLAVVFENGMTEIWDISTQNRTISKLIESKPVRRLEISSNDQIVAFQGGDSFVSMLSVANSAQTARVNGTLPRGSPISPNSQLVSIDQGDTLALYSLSAVAPESQYILYDVPNNATVAYSPDNKIITAFADGDLHYWSTASGDELKESLMKYQAGCQAIYRRTEEFLVAGSNLGVLYSDAHIASFCRVSRDARAVSEAFLNDGSIIAQSLQNQFVTTWDLRGDPPVQNRKKIETPGDVLDVAVSKDGILLAAASAGGTIEIYELQTMQLLKRIELHTGPVNQVIFSNSGKYLIAGSSDGTVRFFGLYP